MNEKGILTPDADGKYHWYYELSIFTNPTVLITLYKVFGGIIIGCTLFLGLVVGLSSGKIDSALGVMGGFGATGIIILVLVTISYAIYAAIQGGKYCVVFEMDKKSVTHIQTAKQFDKAQVIAALATLTGIAKGSLTLVGTGILAGSRNSMKTEFKNVDKIKIKRRRNVIYLHSAFSWNQIYVQADNFNAVLTYILGAIPDSAKGKAEIQAQGGK